MCRAEVQLLFTLHYATVVYALWQAHCLQFGVSRLGRLDKVSAMALQLEV